MAAKATLSVALSCSHQSNRYSNRRRNTNASGVACYCNHTIGRLLKQYVHVNVRLQRRYSNRHSRRLKLLNSKRQSTAVSGAEVVLHIPIRKHITVQHLRVIRVKSDQVQIGITVAIKQTVPSALAGVNRHIPSAVP